MQRVEVGTRQQETGTAHQVAGQAQGRCRLPPAASGFNVGGYGTAHDFRFRHFGMRTGPKQHSAIGLGLALLKPASPFRAFRYLVGFHIQQKISSEVGAGRLNLRPYGCC